MGRGVAGFCDAETLFIVERVLEGPLSKLDGNARVSDANLKRKAAWEKILKDLKANFSTPGEKREYSTTQIQKRYNYVYGNARVKATLMNRYRSATGAGFDQELEDMLELTHPEELIIAKLGKTASFVGIDEGEESTIGKWNSKILNKLRIQKEKDAKKDAKKKDAKKTPSDQVPASDVPINSVLSSNSFDIDLEEDIALHEDDPEDEVAEVNRVRNLVKPTNYSDTLRRKRPHSQLSSRDEELEEDDPDSFFAAPPPTKQQKMDSKGISLLQEVVDELKKKREQDHQMLTAVQSIAHLLQVHFSQISNSRSTTPPFVDLMTNPSFSPVNTPSTSNVLEPFDQGFDRLSGDYNIAKSEKWF